jgi:hypothetical protein
MKFNYNKLEIFLFLISPFLFFPILYRGLLNCKKYSIELTSFLFGLISYSYIPSITNDKVHYFEIFTEYGDVNTFEFIALNLLSSQDFILQLIFHLASKLFIPVNFVFGLITYITVGLILKTVKLIIEHRNNEKIKMNTAMLALFFLSFSFLDLLSGIRFVFAGSFVLYAIYFGLLKKKILLPFFLLLFASFIHFSTLIFIPIFLCLKLIKNQNFYKFIFIGSLLFIILPKEIIQNVIAYFNLSSALESKSNSYLNNDDFVKSGIIYGTIGNFVIYIFSLTWIFCSYVYALFQKHNNSILMNVFLLVAAVMNFLYSFPTIFLRYSIVLKFIFSILLLENYYKTKNKKTILFFISLYSLGILSQIIISRNNIITSFFNLDIISTIFLVFNDPIGAKDFIE